MSEPPQYPSYPGSEEPAGQPGQQPPPPPGYGQTPPAYGQSPPAYGGYPPPPGAYPPPPGYGGQPYAHGAGQARPFAGWWLRVGAAVLDGVIAFAIFVIPLVVGLVITFKDSETDPVTDEITGVNGAGIAILVLTGVLYVAFDIWNRGVRVGSKGRSLGKQIVGITIVKDRDGEVLGAGGGFLRWLMGFVLGIISCVQLLDVLWPLWDDKHQTLHDKVVGSVALKS